MDPQKFLSALAGTLARPRRGGHHCGSVLRILPGDALCWHIGHAFFIELGVPPTPPGPQSVAAKDRTKP